ncbi:hypothetical protein D3C81_1843410 [compost metagenome]
MLPEFMVGLEVMRLCNGYPLSNQAAIVAELIYIPRFESEATHHRPVVVSNR